MRRISRSALLVLTGLALSLGLAATAAAREKAAKQESSKQITAKEAASQDASARKKAAAAEEEARKKAEAELEAKKRAEAKREAEKRAEAEKAARKKADAELEARKKADAEREARKRAEAEEAARKKADAELEAKKRADAERKARKKAEAKKKAEAEAGGKASETKSTKASRARVSPRVDSASPLSVQLEPGGDDEASVSLVGSDLDQLREAEVVRQGRPVSGLRAKLKVKSASEAKLKITLRDKKIDPRSDYQVVLLGASAPVAVPLQIAVRKRASAPTSSSSSGFRPLGGTPGVAPQQNADPQCEAVRTYAWDVEDAYPDADEVEWTLRRNGQEVESDDDDEVDSVTLDLRDYGPVFEGARYEFNAVVLDNGDELGVLPPAIYLSPRLDHAQSFQVVRSQADPFAVTLRWDVPPPMRGCLDAVQYVAFLDGRPLAGGNENGASGENRLDFAADGPGRYQLQLVGLFDGEEPDDQVGVNGSQTFTLPYRVTSPLPPSRVVVPGNFALPGSPFEWERVETVCSGGRAGSQIADGGGDYAIPADQFDGPQCNLRIVWRLDGSLPRSTAEALTDATHASGSGLFTTGGQRIGPVARFRGDPYRFAGEAPLRNLPGLPASLGLRIAQDDGRTLTSRPNYARFVQGAPSQAEAPRILELSVKGSEVRIVDPRIELLLRTAGGQVTHYMVSESDRFTGASWQLFPGTTGAARPVSYTLRDTRTGRKTIYVQVRSGDLESAPDRTQFDFLELANYDIDSGDIIGDAEQLGFTHRAEPLTPDTRCEPVANLVVITGNFGPPRECRFSLFEGDVRLADDWSVRDVVLLTPSPSRSERRVGFGIPNSPRATFTVNDRGRPRADIPPTQVSWYIILKLRGPAGADWRDAFRR